MKKNMFFRTIILLGVFIWTTVSLLPAKENNFGLGVILGEPTGLSFKYWTGPQTALAGALAWSFEHESSFHLHLDYLVHNFHLWQVEQQKIPVYYGIGFRFKSAPGHDRFGVRIPLGISYFLPKVPLEIFFELVPVFDLSPKTDLFFNGGVGIRYYF